jgi:hypothetical protein
MNPLSHAGGDLASLPPWQRAEQYFTASHCFSHFLRQVNGRPHLAQIFCGKCGFLWAILIVWEHLA